jgi:hypothetical protein
MAILWIFQKEFRSFREGANSLDAHFWDIDCITKNYIGIPWNELSS